MPAGAPPFNVALRDAYRSRSVSERNVVSMDGYHRVDSLGVMEGERQVGLFLRLRTNHDAVTATLDAEGLQDLQLREGEVLTEFFAFMYVPEYRVVVVHRNRDAGRQGKLERYAETLTGISPIILAGVITGDAANRLDRMSHTSKAYINIARPENLSLANQDGPAFTLARMAHDDGAARINAEISVGNTRRALGSGFVDSVLRAIGFNRDSVTAATVTGRIDEEIVLVDLVRDLMRETVIVQAEGALSSDAVFWALGQAYDRRRDEIIAMFREPNDD